MSYYKEKNRAKRHAIELINTRFYDRQYPDKIFVNELELDQAPKFECDYMKIFEHIMSIFQEGDRRITYSEGKRYWYIKEDENVPQ